MLGESSCFWFRYVAGERSISVMHPLAPEPDRRDGQRLRIAGGHITSLAQKTPAVHQKQPLDERGEECFRRGLERILQTATSFAICHACRIAGVRLSAELVVSSCYIERAISRWLFLLRGFCGGRVGIPFCGRSGCHNLEALTGEKRGGCADMASGQTLPRPLRRFTLFL